MTAAMLMAGFMAGTEPWWPGAQRVAPSAGGWHQALPYDQQYLWQGAWLQQ